MSLLQGMIPAISTSCNELIKRWEEFTLPQGSYELDVSPELQNLTGDVISRTAFSSNYKEGQRIFQLQKEQIALMIEAAYNLYVPGFKCTPNPLSLFFIFILCAFLFLHSDHIGLESRKEDILTKKCDASI